MRYSVVRTKSGFHVVKQPSGCFDLNHPGIAVSTQPVKCGFALTEDAALAIIRLLST